MGYKEEAASLALEGDASGGNGRLMWWETA